MVTKTQRDNKKYRLAFEKIQELTECKSPFRSTEFYTAKLYKVQKVTEKVLRETSK